MKTRLALTVLVAAGMASVASAQMQPTVFYGGNFDGENGLSDEFNTAVGDAFVFENFNWDGNGTISEIYANYLSDLGPGDISGYNYEIRSGVSANNGGTLEASGTGTGTWTANGMDGFGFTGQTLTSDLMLNISLPAGMYWVALAPIGPGFGRAFVDTTSGAGSIGSPINDDNNYFTSNTFGFSFEPVVNVLGSGVDFSYGITQKVPAPGALALLGLGGLASIRRRR